MLKIFLSVFILLSVALWGKSEEMQRDRVVLQASTISGDDDYLYAKGKIALKHSNTLFLADAARYDKKCKHLVISGNVRIINPDGSRVKTDKITLEVEQKRVVFEKFLYKDKDDIWLSSDVAIKNEDCYELKDALFSSCLVDNPDWHMGFSEAKYNSKTKYIKLKDIKFFVGDTPIFYFPYLAFSTSKERSSGLLMPRIGYNSKYGLLYEQPIFWAINPSMDMEFNPQIRTNRSLGLYSTLRFADSNHSGGYLRLGYFADKDDYASKHNLKNAEHYGLEASYNSSDVLGSSKADGYSDGLYASLLLFNDIDYLNLQKSSLPHLSDSHLKESRINYMLFDDKNYFGLNARYFLDANKDSNQDTLQELPSMRWHKFVDDIGLENLTYSVDIGVYNYIRNRGSESKQVEISIPIKYHASFLDDYLKVEISEEIYLYSGYFDIDTIVNDDYSTVSATHKAKLYADMMKPYISGMHTLQWSLEYAKQSHKGKGVEEYEALDSGLRKDFLTRKPFDDKLTLSLNQFWHHNSLDLGAMQRVSQTYYPDRDEHWGDLRHELEFSYNKWRVINSFEYSFEYQGISELSNKIRYSDSRLYLNMEHFWRKNLEENDLLTNEIAFDVKYKYSNQIKLFGNVTYDLDEKYSKKWKTGILYSKGCWSAELSYTHDTSPILEKDGGGSIDSNTFLVKLNLIPFGGNEISN